jgi:uncharacterized protein (DUF4415 family)
VTPRHRKPGPTPRPRRTPISIKVDPAVLQELRREAERRGLGYQTLINQLLTHRAHRWNPKLVLLQEEK